MANSNSMFVTCNRILVIDVVRDKNRLRFKNGDAFFTGFLSKKMPTLPESIKEGSQVTVGGFVKASMSEKYGLQYSMTITSIVELDHASNRIKSTTVEDDPADAQTDSESAPVEASKGKAGK